MIIIKKEKKLKEEKPVLDERKKCHLEFLSKLNSFYEYFHKEINEHKNYKSSTEGCLYIINPKLIENLKEFYYYDEIKSLFEKDKKISEIIKSLSDEYIKKIQKQNDDIIRDQIYFYPHTKLYENLNLKYFINSTIVDSDLIKILYKDKDISNKLENSRVFYSISNRKLILRYGLIINIGNLDDNNIFNSDILIMCSSKSFESTYKEIKSMSIDNFINNVKIIEKNIGNYKEDNKVVFINENYIPETPQKDNNTPLYSPTSKKEEVGKQNGQIPMNSEYIYNNGILPIPVNMMKNTLSHHSEDNNSLLQSEKFLNTLNINKAPSLNMNVGNLGLQNMQGQQLMNIIYEIQRKNQNIPQNNENIAKQNEEKQKKMLEEQKMKEIMKKKNQIEKLIYIMIDLRKTNIKINLSLDKNTYYEKYYLINADWFNEFSKNSQMNILCNNNIIFNSIKAAAYNNFNMSNRNILEILKKDKTVEKEIDNISKLLKDNNSPNKFQIDPQIGKTSLFNYYYNFVLISVETINKLFKVDNKIPSLNCLFGDKSIFLLFNKNIITYEIKDNKYIPKLIFSFYDKAYLNETINLIKENHLENYKKYYMLFNEDYASPIFNKNNNEIGYAFLYHPNIQDY